METLTQWLQGDLSTTARIWTSLAPAILLAGYFFAGLAVYTVLNRFNAPSRDREMDDRGSSVVLSMFLRQYFAWLMHPVFWVLRRSGLPPNAITTLSVLLAGASGVALAAGRFALGGWLYIFAGICDFMDGRLARITGASTQRGAALATAVAVARGRAEGKRLQRPARQPGTKPAAVEGDAVLKGGGASSSVAR